jgi:hypothetical protein
MVRRERTLRARLLVAIVTAGVFLVASLLVLNVLDLGGDLLAWTVGSITGAAILAVMLVASGRR